MGPPYIQGLTPIESNPYHSSAPIIAAPYIFITLMVFAIEQVIFKLNADLNTRH